MDIQTSKGTIHFEVYGDGHPLIILHALAMDHRSMKAWIEPIFEGEKREPFLPQYKRIYVNLPAHGHSRIHESVTTTDEWLTSLLEFIEEFLSGETFSLVGMSFGGYLSQGLLQRKKSQINKLCLLVPVLHLTNRILPQKVIAERDEELLAELEPDAKAAFEILMTRQTRANWELFQEEIQPGRMLANRQFLQSGWRTNGYFLGNNPLEGEAYPHPSLILLGQNDAICGYQDHFTLLETFPHSRMMILDDSGHMVQIEQRAKVQELLVEWLKQ